MADLVRQEKEVEAARVNKSGLKRQLEFLVQTMGQAELEKRLAAATAARLEVKQAAAAVHAKSKLGDLVGLVYLHKQMEGDSLAVEGVEAQIRFLLSKLGGKDRLGQVLG